MLRFEKAKEQINNNIVKNLRFKMLSLILCKHWTTYGRETTSYRSFVYMRTILSGFTNFKLSVLVALFTLNNYAIRSANYACAQPYHPHSRTHGQVPFVLVRAQKLGVSSEKKRVSVTITVTKRVQNRPLTSLNFYASSPLLLPASLTTVFTVAGYG